MIATGSLVSWWHLFQLKDSELSYRHLIDAVNVYYTFFPFPINCYIQYLVDGFSFALKILSLIVAYAICFKDNPTLLICIKLCEVLFQNSFYYVFGSYSWKDLFFSAKLFCHCLQSIVCAYKGWCYCLWFFFFFFYLFLFFIYQFVLQQLALHCFTLTIIRWLHYIEFFLFLERVRVRLLIIKE